MQPACLLLEASTCTCKTDMQFALVNSDHCTIDKIQNQSDILFLFTMQDRHAVCPAIERVLPDQGAHVHRKLTLNNKVKSFPGFEKNKSINGSPIA